MNDIVKKCKNHGDLLITDVIKSGRNKSGTPKFKCRMCMSDMHKRHYINNKEKINEKHSSYRVNNLEKVRLIRNTSAKKYRDKNREKDRTRKRINKAKDPTIVRERQKRWSKKGVKQLSDWYIKQIFVKDTILQFKDVSPDLVKTQRELMKLKRNLKKEKESVEDI